MKIILIPQEAKYSRIENLNVSVIDFIEWEQTSVVTTWFRK